jgi:hypothetical protein
MRSRALPRHVLRKSNNGPTTLTQLRSSTLVSEFVTFSDLGLFAISSLSRYGKLGAAPRMNQLGRLSELIDRAIVSSRIMAISDAFFRRVAAR